MNIRVEFIYGEKEWNMTSTEEIVTISEIEVEER